MQKNKALQKKKSSEVETVKFKKRSRPTLEQYVTVKAICESERDVYKALSKVEADFGKIANHNILSDLLIIKPYLQHLQAVSSTIESFTLSSKTFSFVKYLNFIDICLFSKFSSPMIRFVKHFFCLQSINPFFKSMQEFDCSCTQNSEKIYFFNWNYLIVGFDPNKISLDDYDSYTTNS